MSRNERRGSRDSDRVAEVPVVETGGARLNRAGAGAGGIDDRADRQRNGHDGSRRPGDLAELAGSDRKRGGAGEPNVVFGMLN